MSKVGHLKAPSFLVPFVLRLPDPLFQIMAAKLAKTDDAVRSSMLQDFDRHAAHTEVVYFNGEVVRLCQEKGIPAPVNEAIMHLIQTAEAAGQGSPKISPQQLLKMVALEHTSFWQGWYVLSALVAMLAWMQW